LSPQRAARFNRYQLREEHFVNKKTSWKNRKAHDLVVAPASASTWVVAFARQLIPGALFKTRDAAVRYANMLAGAAGLNRTHVKVLGA
jgi:hypothetical protein